MSRLPAPTRGRLTSFAGPRAPLSDIPEPVPDQGLGSVSRMRFSWPVVESRTPMRARSSARLSPLPKGSYTDESLKTLTPLPASLFSGFHLRKALCSYFLRYVRGRQQSQFIVFRLLFLGQFVEQRFIFNVVCWHKIP